MRCTVVSSAEVRGELAEIWMRAPDRNEVSRSANRIDHLLRTSADKIGHSDGDAYWLTYGCLTVRYRIFPDDCLVQILEYELVQP